MEIVTPEMEKVEVNIREEYIDEKGHICDDEKTIIINVPKETQNKE